MRQVEKETEEYSYISKYVQSIAYACEMCKKPIKSVSTDEKQYSIEFENKKMLMIPNTVITKIYGFHILN